MAVETSSANVVWRKMPVRLERLAVELGGASLWETCVVAAKSLLLLAFLTAALIAVKSFVDVETVTLIYLIAVLFAATRGGAVPAIVTALAAIGASAFFFYPPIYDFRVHNPIHLIDIALFIVVAAVTGKLAMDVRKAKMREQADALREALIGSVSHELRSPLSSIVGSASILATSPEITANARALSLVQGVQEEADRLNDHIQNLLDSTRISSEGVRPHAEWVDPGDIITTAIERKRRLLSKHRIDLAVETDLPMVHVDPLLIEKALGHLLENAAKYSPADSSIEIRAKRFNGMVRLAVRDKGAGLSREEERRIWDRFYRSPRHRNISGAGLGLWIAHALVTACGGHVEAFSSGIGQGTTLSLFLPVPQGEGPSEPEAAEQ